MTGPWKWTALPGLRTRTYGILIGMSGRVYLDDGTGKLWLTSELRPEPPHDPRSRRP